MSVIEQVSLQQCKRVDIVRRRWTVACVVLAAVVTVSCTSGGDRSVSAGTWPDQLDVGRFASENPGSVNTYWLATSSGLVVIDAQRTPSDADSALEAMPDTDLPVASILITHAHPDHVGGLGAIHDAYAEAPVLASEATIAAMEDDPLGLFELARQDLDEYPDQLTIPDQAIGDDERLKIGDVELMAAELGPAEAFSMSVYYEPQSGSLFTGDLVNHAATPALLEGHTCSWLTQLTELQERFPKARTLYPGHGAPGDPDELIAQQRSYLLDVRRLVRSAVAPESSDGSGVSSAEQASIGAELERLHPGDMDRRVASLPADMLLELNLDAVANELQAERPSDLPDACRGT